MNPGKWLKKKRQALQIAWYGRFGRVRSPEQWVFVVGCYNSGTTLLHDILASHPAIASLPREGQYCTDQLPIPADMGLARAWALKPELFRLDLQDTDQPDAGRIKRQWSCMMSPGECTTYLEKSIPNAARIPWLDKNFENARFVGIVRNGYAVSEGIMRKGGKSVEQAAEQWAESNRIMLHDLNRVAQSHLLTYEELARNPADTIGSILEFLQLPAMPSSPGQKVWQVHGLRSEIRDMNSTSLDRLNDAERAAIEHRARSLLSEFGYLESPASSQ